MKKFGIVLAALVLLGVTSCAAGPQQLYRTLDDIDQKLYVDQPIVDGVLYFIPVIPLAKYVAAIGDFLIVNPYHFWLNDIWDGTGTGFEHLEVDAPDGRVKSLYIDDAQFLFAD